MMLEKLSILDYIILIYLSYHTINGFKKGVITILIETITIILTIIITLSYYPQLAIQLQLYYPTLTDTHSTLISICFIIIFMLTGSWIINKLIITMISLSGLSILNRFTGAIIGCIKGICITLTLLIPLLWLAPSIIQDSQLLITARQLIPINMPQTDTN